MRACISVMSDNQEMLAALMAKAARLRPYMIEARLDLMDIDTIPRPPASKAITLATVRSRAHGGQGTGDPSPMLRQVFEAGFDMMDVELGTGIWDRERTVCSYHDPSSTPTADEVEAVMRDMADRAAIAKGAFMVRSMHDLHQLLTAADRLDIPRMVLIGMGEMGTLTRIRHRRIGCEFTFASMGINTAPGQLPFTDLRWLGDDCLLTGIIGHPVDHSMSPSMHDAAFRGMGIRGRYLKLTTTVDELEEAMDVIRWMDIKGVNVTMPLKRKVMDHLDQVAPTAARAGAVNTVLNQGGKLIGHNTDIEGVAHALSGRQRPETALVIGAGGAARACCLHLLDIGCMTHVMNRDRSKALDLARDLGAEVATTEHMPITDLIVNCTPLGMEGHDPGPPVGRETLEGAGMVMDMVYHPRETPFLRLARSMDLDTINGEAMLLGQAMESFRIWTGVRPEEELMANALEGGV